VPDARPVAPLDGFLAGLGGLISLATYGHTLAPGLVAIRDTPAFQYMGRVLGVPHQPGYPFYVLVSHLFSLVPVGSLAYRMNLLSALFGAACVVLMCGVLRALRCSPVVAFSFSLCAAFGPVVWSQSIIAEVYSLESLLVLATILVFLRWRVTRSTRLLVLGAFVFGLSAAHHPDQWTLAPALAAFVWCTDTRPFGRPATVLLVAGALAMAFAPYALIVIRTSQGAPYVLEPAYGLTDLWRIYSGAGYRENLFAFPLTELLTSRGALVLGLLWSEVGAVGAGLVIVGAVAMARTDRAVGLLLAVQSLGQVAFTANYDVPDIAVFVIPLAYALWIVAAAGAEVVRRALAGAGRPWAVGTHAALLVMPAWSGISHDADADLSWSTATMWYMEGALRQMPDRTAVLAENWVADQLLLYHTLGVGLRPGQFVLGPSAATSQQIDEWLSAKQAVFAFEGRADALRLAGFPMVPERVRIPIHATLEALRPGSIVAVAVPAEFSPGLDNGSTSGLSAIQGTVRIGGRQIALAALGVRGARHAAVERTGPRETLLQMPSGEPIPATSARLPVPVEIHAGQTDARISAGGRDIVHTSDGIAVAVWDREGRLRDVGVSSVTSTPGLTIEPSLLFRVAGARTCTVLQGEPPADLGPLAASGLIAVSAPGDTRVDIGVTPAETDAELSASLLDASRGSRYAFGREAGHAADAAVATHSRWWTLSTGAHGPDAWALVGVGGPVPNVAARVVARVTRPVTVCAVDIRALTRRVDDRTLVVGMGNDSDRFLLGPGWHAPASGEGGPFRWMLETRASMSVPLDPGSSWLVRVVAFTPHSSNGQIGLRFNAVACEQQAVSTGWHTYEWTATSATPVVTVDILSTRLADVAGVGQAGLAVGSVSFTRLDAGAGVELGHAARCGAR
jgi:Protein O-mannosyl-transferase TMEM260-like